MRSKIKKIIETCLIFMFDNFIYSYVAVSLVLMLNLHLLVFLVWDIVMIVASATKTPSDFKIVKL
jgi:hypothetical protein